MPGSLTGIAECFLPCVLKGGQQMILALFWLILALHCKEKYGSGPKNILKETEPISPLNSTRFPTLLWKKTL